MSDLEKRIEYTIHNHNTTDQESYLDDMPFKVSGYFDPEGVSLSIAPVGFEYPVELYIRIVNGVPRVSFYNDEGADCLGYVDLTVNEGVAMVYDRNQSAEPEVCEAEEAFKKDKMAEFIAKKNASGAVDKQVTAPKLKL